MMAGQVVGFTGWVRFMVSRVAGEPMGELRHF